MLFRSRERSQQPLLPNPPLLPNRTTVETNHHQNPLKQPLPHHHTLSQLQQQQQQQPKKKKKTPVIPQSPPPPPPLIHKNPKDQPNHAQQIYTNLQKPTKLIYTNPTTLNQQTQTSFSPWTHHHPPPRTHLMLSHRQSTPI